MNIVLFQCVYNEVDLLPFKMQYAHEQGFDVIYTMDNYSTDGSWEWLQSQGYPGHQFDTEGMFSLARLNAEYARAIHYFKPDWAVIAGADMFYYVRRHGTLRQFIEKVNAQGFNTIDFANLFNFKFTGVENDHFDPRTQYFFYHAQIDHPIQLAFRYHADLEISGESLVSPNRKIIQNEEIITLHYWLRSDWQPRKQAQLQRRQKAWQAKIDNPYWGRHYQTLAARQEVNWPAQDLRDIREHWVWDEHLNFLE